MLALLLRGADIHARGDSDWDALMNASYYGQVAAATVLLDRGADVLARDDDQDTALHWAAGKDKPEMCELLLSKGADLTAVDNDNQTPLDLYGDYAYPPPRIIGPSPMKRRKSRQCAAWSL